MFESDKYIGVDPNRAAIEQAKKTYPLRSFHVLQNYGFPPSMAKFAYTVAMHVPDEEYAEFIFGMCDSTGDQIVIAEILGRDKRRKLEKKKIGYIHATFGRSMDDHEREFRRNGFSLVTYHEHNYPGKGTSMGKPIAVKFIIQIRMGIKMKNMEVRVSFGHSFYNRISDKMITSQADRGLIIGQN